MKTATLYAYVSRGILPRHRSPDGRTSLFDPADVSRLERRGGDYRSAPSDVTVTSELTLIDSASGRLWYRGVDVLRACREFQFEEIASLLWTGGLDRMDPWRADARSLTRGTQAQATLDRRASLADRVALIASGVAAAHAADGSDLTAASDLLACLVDGLPGRADGTTIAQRLTAKLGGRSLIDVLDAALSLVCEQGLTHAALVARLTTSAGAGVASAVVAAMHAALSHARSLTALETAFATAAHEGPARGAELVDSVVAGAHDPFRPRDQRASVLLAELADVAPAEASAIEVLTAAVRERGIGEPSVWYALAGVTWAAGMPLGAAGAIALIAQSAGWIAHALEEHARPTPYRPRLAYTGPPPRDSTPRRTLDAVTDYLSRG